jgi:Na+-transporting NADH:ubiquinone oxidoreductase subunit NqrB
MARKISMISVSLLMLISGILIIPTGMETASGETWTKTTDTDYTCGVLNNLEVTDTGPSASLRIDPGRTSLRDWTSSGDDQAGANYGYSVANAGDVNGDGYDDVIVGAYLYDTTKSFAGKAYLYFGSTSGLSTSASWNSSGDNKIAAFYGWSVASAGDVNMDGYDDVIVGAYGYNTLTPNTDAGKAYLYLGGASGLSDSASWTSSGDDQAYAFYGYSVASAGDVNGDGYDDVIVGANEYTTANIRAGKAYLYLGGATGLSTSPAWTSSGDDNQTYVYYGRSVASAGDVNGDGFDDVIVGAHRYNASNTDAGKAFLYFGSASGLSTSSSWNSSGDDQSFAYYGNSVASAGDVNGDGYDDAIIGAYCYNTPTPNNCAGKAYLYFGNASGLSTSTAWTSSGEDDQTDVFFGWSIASAGDVNGDGYDDAIIGARSYDTTNKNASKAYLYLGNTSGLSINAMWTSSGDNQDNAYFGWSVASAGDVNADGYDDVIIGAKSFDTVNTNAGKAYLYTGIWASVGDDQTDAFYGWSVACAGDVNGDGYNDVIVGAPYFNNAISNEGKAYLYLGSASGLSTSASWTSSGDNQSDARYGWSVASAGDVNMDGFDDVIVSAPYHDTANNDAGKAYLYLGGVSGLSTSAAWTSSGDDQKDAYYGNSVACAGDVNRDGYDDVIVGAHMYDTINVDEGKAYLYLGGASGLSTSAFWTSSGDNQTNAVYGHSVAGAGDVNADGYDDVIVGAFSYDLTTGNEGKAYLYLGSASGLTTTASWTSSGDEQGGAEYGCSVACAGDVNADGYDDVIVGACEFDTPNSDAGKTYLYLGGASGLSTNIAWISTGDDQKNANFGYSVASAGDVNGDSYDDVIVGAYGYETANIFAGKTYLYLGRKSGLSTNTARTSIGDDQASAIYGYSVAGAGDVNGDGYDDVIVGAIYYDTANSNTGKTYLYRGGPLRSGIYTSEIFDAGILNPQWQSLSWHPHGQLAGTGIKFQVATSNTGYYWYYTGPDGCRNTYYTSSGGGPLYSRLEGRYLRYRMYFITSDFGDSPRIDDVTITYRESETPEIYASITVTSPNGGEDWMKGKYYPITWEAEGELHDGSVNLFFSLDNGANWTPIAVGIPNFGFYNWTVPNNETANALIGVTITDVYGNEVSDSSDASFAIDPPPPGAGGVPSGGGTQFPPDGQPGTEHEEPGGGAGKSNELWGIDPGIAIGIIILGIFLTISIITNFYFFTTRNKRTEIRKDTNNKHKKLGSRGKGGGYEQKTIRIKR